MQQRQLILGFAGALIASVHACLMADELPAVERTARANAARETGAIEGTVIYRADPQRSWRYARYYVKDRRQGQLAEAVVALKSPAVPRDGSDKATAVVDQENFQFTPETLAIRAGDRVKFLNNDNSVHNVRTVHRRHSFNTNIAAGEEYIETFKHATGLRSPYRIECVYHGSMRSWIYVFDHPYFQLTGADGRFRLADVPPGEYVLEMAHPAGQLRSRRKVEVAAGETTQLDIVVSAEDKRR